MLDMPDIPRQMKRTPMIIPVGKDIKMSIDPRDRRDRHICVCGDNSKNISFKKARNKRVE